MLGPITLWPFVWFAIFAFVAVRWATTPPSSEELLGSFNGTQFANDMDSANRLFNTLFAGTVVTGLLSLATLAYCLWDAATSPAVLEQRRTMWCALLVFANVVAAPVYWWVNIRKAIHPHNPSGGEEPLAL